MFYYAFWNAVFALCRRVVWITPNWPELAAAYPSGLLAFPANHDTQGCLSDRPVLVPLDYSRIVYPRAWPICYSGTNCRAWELPHGADRGDVSLYLLLRNKSRSELCQGPIAVV